MSYFRSSRKGFTLIELMIVIAIIAVLSAVALASYSVTRTKGRDARRIADLRGIKQALESYYDSNQSYPMSTSTLVSGGFMAGPAVPPPGGSYFYSATQSATGANRSACTTNPCTGFVLYAQLEQSSNTVLNTDADVSVGSTYYGNSANCLANSGTDSCYDIAN